MEPIRGVETERGKAGCLTMAVEGHNHSVPSLHKVYDDGLRKIFSYLTLTERLSLEAVCKRWENLLKGSWNTVRNLRMADFMVSYSSRREGLTKRRIETISRRNLLSLESLDFGEAYYGEDFDFSDVLGLLAEIPIPNLRELDLGIMFPAASIPSLQLFPQLKRLNLIVFPVNDGMQVGTDMGDVFRSLTGLEELTVSGIYNDYEFPPIVGEIPHELWLKDIAKSIRTARIYTPANSALGWFQCKRFKRGITRVQLKHFFETDRTALVDLRLDRMRIRPESADLSIIAVGAPNLKILDLSCTTGFRNLMSLAELEHLEELYLHEFSVAPDEPGTGNSEEDRERPFLYYLGRSQSRYTLRVFHINSFYPLCSQRDQNLEEIGRLTELKHLSLSHCKQLNMERLDLITRGCSQLESIVLHHGVSLNDAALASIGRQSPNLQSLDITRCPITWKGVQGLLRGLETFVERKKDSPLLIYTQYSGLWLPDLQEDMKKFPWLKIDDEGTLNPHRYHDWQLVGISPHRCEDPLAEDDPEFEDNLDFYSVVGAGRGRRSWSEIPSDDES